MWRQMGAGGKFAFLKKPLIGVFVGGMALCAVLFVGFDVVAHTTKSNEFCTSCHTMHGPFSEYQGTAHYQNKAGVQAGCSNCHVPSSGPELLWAKVRASKDVYHQLIGTIDSKDDFEANRLRMAKVVWDRMEATDSRECRSCHDFSNMDLLAQRPGARKYHEVAIKDNVTCISCHKGISHFLPESSGSDDGVAKLREAAKQIPATATALYAIETIPFHISPQARDANDGKLMPSAKVEKLGEEGGFVKVRISGWRQEGVDKLAYFDVGKRVLSAVFSNQVAEKVTPGEYVQDKESGQKWTAVSIEAWVEKGRLVDKQQMVWDVAKGLMAENCGSCHAEPDLGHYTANQWIGVIQSMQTRTAMNDEQKRLLMQFAQKHGSDMNKAGKH